MRWVIAGSISLALGALCAPGYAQWTAACDAALARLLARSHPWQIDGVAVGPSGTATQLLLTATVRRNDFDAAPGATVVAHMDAGASIEAPLVFWTLLLLWPTPDGQRPSRVGLRRVVMGLPVFLLLHVATTIAPLMSELSAVSATLAGAPDGITLPECWSRFLEAGGRFVIEVAAGLSTAALSDAVLPTTQGAVTRRRD